jgi:hypothetical protein
LQLAAALQSLCNRFATCSRFVNVLRFCFVLL